MFFSRIILPVKKGSVLTLYLPRLPRLSIVMIRPGGRPGLVEETRFSLTTVHLAVWLRDRLEADLPEDQISIKPDRVVPWLDLPSPKIIFMLSETLRFLAFPSHQTVL